MRNFLKDIFICGGVLAFREGKLIRYCLNNLIKYCDHIVVVLDNHNKETEKIVLSYKKKHPGLFTVVYSGLGRYEPARLGALKSRLNRKQARIRQRVLDEVSKLNEKQKVDILLFPDADEIFTKYLPDLLIKFWEGDKKVISMRPITIFDSFNIIRKHTLIPHCRIFKYQPEISTAPWRHRCFYQPFTYEDMTIDHYVLVHLPLLSRKTREYRRFYTGRTGKWCAEYGLWKTEKDVRKMSVAEVKELLQKPQDFTTNEYLTKTYGTTSISEGS